ncbi:helix-turn-helix domain-containing protein [Salinisphaera sp. SWV1]|uniref:helix-turn-helix domain-containing protein n=1 Tax=Salinisphaera sp. SWV1 TaxID=3454139 RepID=UPI003F8351BD
MSPANNQKIHDQIARNIKTFRTEREITLTGLSELTGIGKSTLSNLERGQGNPTIETLWQLAQVLDVGYGDLVGNAPPQSSTSEGVSVELINFEDSDRKIETFSMKLAHGAVREADAHATGVTEHVLVLSGALIVGGLDDRAMLYAGQAKTFKADDDHVYRAGERGAHAIVSVIYPDQRATCKDTHAIRLDWPTSNEGWSGVSDLVTRLCVDAKHGIPFGRVRLTDCALDFAEAFETLESHLGPESKTEPGMSLTYAGNQNPEIIVLSSAGTHERIPKGDYPPSLAKAIELSNRAARRRWLSEAELAALREQAAAPAICVSTLAAEILTNAGYPTAPSHVGVKNATSHADSRLDTGVSFEDRIDVDSDAAFELVHPAYARQCVEVATHLYRAGAAGRGPVLDVGTGSGLPLAMIDELIPETYFAAVNPSRTAHRYLETRFENNPRITTALAGIADIPASPKYDHVISIGASHHLDTTQFLSNIRGRMNSGGTLCVSDEMITSFGNKAERRDHLLAHHLRYIHDTRVRAHPAQATADEISLVELCHRTVPGMLYNALAGKGEVAAGQARRLLSQIHHLDLPARASTPELAFYRFHALELEALIAGLDDEVEQKTSPACFLDLAREIGFELIAHRRIYATHGRDPWHAGTHVFALEAV